MTLPHGFKGFGKKQYDIESLSKNTIIEQKISESLNFINEK